jgi:hypothetical protein
MTAIDVVPADVADQVLARLVPALRAAGVPVDLAALEGPAPMAVPATGRIPDVVDGVIIESAWGNAIRDRSVTPFATVADRDASTPGAPNGALCVTFDTGQLWARLSGVWYAVGPGLSAAGQTQVSVGGSAQTGIAASTTIATLTITPAPWKRTGILYGHCRVDNETAAAGLMGVRLESGSTLVQNLQQFPATAAYVNTYTLPFPLTVAAGATTPVNMVAFRQSGTCTGKTWSDATLNRLSVLLVPSA